MEGNWYKKSVFAHFYQTVSAALNAVLLLQAKFTQFRFFLHIYFGFRPRNTYETYGHRRTDRRMNRRTDGRRKTSYACYRTATKIIALDHGVQVWLRCDRKGTQVCAEGLTIDPTADEADDKELAEVSSAMSYASCKQRICSLKRKT